MKSSSATCMAYTPDASTTNTAWSTKYTKKKKIIQIISLWTHYER